MNAHFGGRQRLAAPLISAPDTLAATPAGGQEQQPRPQMLLHQALRLATPTGCTRW